LRSGSQVGKFGNAACASSQLVAKNARDATILQASAVAWPPREPTISRRGNVVRYMITAVSLALLSTIVSAADITVLSSGVSLAGVKKLAAAWTLQTGNKVTFRTGTVGMVRDDANSGQPADVVVLPPDDLKVVAGKVKPGTIVPIGRVWLGVVVKAGAPHPDISTVDGLATALRASSGIGYADPTGGSLAGSMIANLLKQPKFAGVRGVPLREYVADMVAKDLAQYAGSAISEELTNPAAELVGPFPASLDMHIDLSAAVLKSSAAPADAASFLSFIARPEAATAWNDCGVEMAGAPTQLPRGSCYVVIPTVTTPPDAEEVRAPRPPRARGIPAALAIEAAQTAIAACLDSGYRVTALVVDSAGVPIAMVSGDGAAAVTQRIAMGKAQTVLKFHMTSGEAAAKAKNDTAFMAQLMADPQVGVPRQGAIPIMVGADTVGALAVSGAPGGDKDEPCAITGLARIRQRQN
jgi:molybdate transport system substrate-binding protein